MMGGALGVSTTRERQEKTGRPRKLARFLSLRAV
jgi:hypothetical protein